MNRNSKRNEDMEPEKEMRADVVIVGTGAAGLFAALNLPGDRKVLIITKKDAESSDSFLAQGGICVLKDESDYESYFEDTMRAGHYENRKESVDIMIRSSREIIRELIGYGVKFERRDKGVEPDAPKTQENFLDDYAFTREGAHSRPRILFHEDVTGKEITSKLLAQVRALENVRIMEYTTMTDIIVEDKDVQTGEDRTLYQLSASYGGCPAYCRKARDTSGTSGLCTDPSDDAVFQETWKEVPDLGVRQG